MGNLFRSEDMHLVQLFLQVESAHDVVEQLGRLNDGKGVIQFEDLNPNVNTFKKRFVNEVKRCDEMERQLRFFAEQIESQKITKEEASASPQYSGGMPIGTNSTARMDDLDARFTETEAKLQKMNENQAVLDKSFIQLVDIKHILQKTAVFFDEAPMDFTDQPADVGNDSEEKAGLLSGGVDAVGSSTAYPKAIKLGFVTGLIQREKVAVFERILWRATRGNLFMRQAEVETPLRDANTGEEVKKNVFIIFFQGERLSYKINKICESMGVSVYPCPDTASERRELLTEVNTRLMDLNKVLQQTRLSRREVLVEVAQQLPGWWEVVRTEKAIFHTMNLFTSDMTRKALVAEGWTPTSSTADIQAALDAGTRSAGSSIRSVFYEKKTKRAPPTYFKTNDFSVMFQWIVDSYGMATYKEANPGPFTIITFPFLFGLMFGDIGHGLMLTLCGLAMFAYNNFAKADEMSDSVRVALRGRWLLLFMGLFATYAGIMYNDMFALMIAPFDSTWEENQDDGVKSGVYKKIVGQVYPVGIDWAWAGAGNKMALMNSVKMKLSIIIGVAQMGFGVVLSLTNNLYFKNHLNIICETIPQLLFLGALFGYMVVLIIAKWLTDWSQDGMIAPPQILPTTIGMLLYWSKPIDAEELWYTGQHGLQQTLALIMLVAIPWMLVPKPYILYRRHKAHEAASGTGALAYDQVRTEDQTSEHPEGEEEEEEEFELAEVVVHQVIHTIEYVLGTVSNTASYLRLWALSLAHAELSEVFWEQIFFRTLESGSPIMIFCGFTAWAAATVGVLLVMECMSAFLHALRLHWVEFQNKFYAADGHAFRPFGLKNLGNEDD